MNAEKATINPAGHTSSVRADSGREPNRWQRVQSGAALAATCLVLMTPHARAELSPEELAKLAQNPVGNLVSVPIQNNTNFNVGPRSGTQNIMNIQPVYPVNVNSEWNVITRTVLPLIWQPGSLPGQDSTFGMGDIQFSALLSPAVPKGYIWGVGAVVQAPTDTQGLGNKNWGMGPTAVILKMEKGNPWVYGALFNNVWSLSNSGTGGSYNNFMLQPFVNYNLPGGTYINTVPVITANWNAASGQQWTVPLGLGVGHIFHLGKLPVNMQLGGYYNVVHPDDGANWQLRFQVQVMFPK